MFVYSTVQYRVLILFIIRGYVCVQYSTVQGTHIVYYNRLCMCIVQYSTGYSYCLLSEVMYVYSTVQYRVLILFIIRGYGCEQYSTVQGTHIAYYQRLWL